MRHETSFWWEPIELAVGEGRRWRLGSVEIAIVRSEAEWHTADRLVPDEEIVAEDWSVDPIDTLVEDDDHAARFASDPEARRVRLLPQVAHRSVVVSPRIPLHVLPNHEAKFYVSSPIWLEISVGPPWTVLHSVPARRLSDTWFGPSTIEGEVAFALKTQARVRLEDLPRQVHRAITPVVVKNRSEELLTVSQLNLPVPYLSLFHTEAGALWTETVVLAQRDETGLAGLDIEPGSPAEAGKATLLSKPRQSADANVLVRAFSSILRTLDLED